MQGALRARGIFEQAWNEFDALGGEFGASQPAFDLRLMATMFDQGAETDREFLIALQARFGEIMLESVVHRSEVLRRAVAYGVPASELEPAGQAVQDFMALAGDVLEHAAERGALPCPDLETGGLIPWMP